MVKILVPTDWVLGWILYGSKSIDPKSCPAIYPNNNERGFPYPSEFIFIRQPNIVNNQ